MSGPSLNADYFDGIFGHDDDPWNLASSDYEAAKFDATMAALSGRRYARGFEVGCAHGVLTERLTAVCNTLLAIDISTHALAKAFHRVGDRRGLTLAKMAFPKEHPDTLGFDLIVLSEVAYYWGPVDLDRASEWLKDAVVDGGRVILVHWTGKTDYPQTGDGAVKALWNDMSCDFQIETERRTDEYRLDLWVRR